jgi:hypothetical protein
MIEVILNEMIEERKRKNNLCLIIDIELEDGKTITCLNVETYQCTLTGHCSDSEDSEWIALKAEDLNEVNVIKKNDIRKMHAFFSDRKYYTYE